MSRTVFGLPVRLAVLVAGCLFFAVPGSWAQIEIDEPPTPASSSAENDEHFDWGPALAQSGFLLGIQHSLRMFQEKTRVLLGGPFWQDYLDALHGLHGWDDHNPWITNYLGHPMMGSIAGFIQVQNDPRGRTLEWDPHNRAYWNSRLKGFGWATGYSTIYELSPIGEAGIGNVGKTPGTMAFVDLVVTPLGGFGLMLLEDYIDARVIRKMEAGKSPGTVRFLRVLMNPDRAIANMMRLKRPSHRDTRPPPR
jgi:hypothetical protein